MDKTNPESERTPDLSADFLGAAECLVLIPKNDGYKIAPGSGITAFKTNQGGFQIDFEGHIYGQNTTSLEDKLLRAADRGYTRYPTVARLFLSRQDLDKDFTVAGVLDYARLKTALGSYIEKPLADAMHLAWEIYPEKKAELEAWAKKEQ